jgi:hypothetical protein
MPDSCGPLSAAADGLAEGVVAGADGGDDAAEDELAAEQPAMREVAAAARPNLRGERELRKVAAIELVRMGAPSLRLNELIRGDGRQQIMCELDTQAI